MFAKWLIMQPCAEISSLIFVAQSFRFRDTRCATNISH
jgi:hypothetical protein